MQSKCPPCCTVSSAFYLGSFSWHVLHLDSFDLMIFVPLAVLVMTNCLLSCSCAGLGTSACLTSKPTRWLLAARGISEKRSGGQTAVWICARILQRWEGGVRKLGRRESAQAPQTVVVDGGNPGTRGLCEQECQLSRPLPVFSESRNWGTPPLQGSLLLPHRARTQLPCALPARS